MSLIAIDGRAGAGKTTLARELYERLSQDKSVSVIHMDDLYNGWHNALNIDLTSKLETIIDAFVTQVEISIPIFNWTTMSFDSSQLLVPSEVLIIEGVGAGQKVVRDAGAILHWLDIESEEGLARVLARDGMQIEIHMRQWQVDQEEHFQRDATRKHAHHLLTSQP